MQYASNDEYVKSRLDERIAHIVVEHGSFSKGKERKEGPCVSVNSESAQVFHDRFDKKCSSEDARKYNNKNSYRSTKNTYPNVVPANRDDESVEFM